MTESKKIKKIIDIIVILLCVFPLIFVLCGTILNHVDSINNIDVGSIVTNMNISDYWLDIVSSVTDQFLMINGEYSGVVNVVAANTICIYLAYLLIEVLVFLPKLFISWMRRF